MKPAAWAGTGDDGVVDIAERRDIADQWISDGLKVEPLVTLSAANAAIEERDKRIAELEAENAGLLQSSRHSADWATSAIADMKAAEARAASLEAMVVEALEALEPFADCAREWDGEDDALHVSLEWNDEGKPVPSLPVIDFRIANRAARSIAAKIGGRND